MALSDKELEKIKLMQQFRTGERTDLPNVDSDEFKLSKIKSMLDKANANENNIKEMTRDTFERMDGLVDQTLLKEFLDTFEEIYSNYVEGGDPFDTSEVIDFLSIMMQNRAEDARLDSRSFEEGVNEEKTISITKDQMEKLHKGEPVKLANKSFLYKVDAPKKEGVNEGDPIVDETEFNFFKEFFGIGSDNVIPNTNATDEEIEAYLKSDDYQEELKYSDLEEKDIANWVESFLDWRSKNTLQEVDGGVEFFKRIAFKK